ncbi:unnamed protein product [Triticum turgidum subsp. durum]|uniref:CP12 domain-containing protein n=1 Tax=Triticum turgidum subsp. durum TaxID=4567 RepID=A0A9R0S7S6_TRITD|nr:unnamed protein product [Triticum turgidum subsp. durum]
MATITTMAFMATFPAPRTVAQPPATLPSRPNVVSFAARAMRAHGRRLVAVAGSPSTPPELAQKVTESIKQAEETHARDRKKEHSDPLEEFCEDNPETDECRTYDS